MLALSAVIWLSTVKLPTTFKSLPISPTFKRPIVAVSLTSRFPLTEMSVNVPCADEIWVDRPYTIPDKSFISLVNGVR